MSFLTDLFEGKISNLGNDLSPSNIFSDTQQDIGGKYTIPEVLGVAGLAAGGLGLAGALPGIAGLGADAATLAPDAAVAADTASDALGFAGDATTAGTGLDAINTAIGAGGDTGLGTNVLSLAAPDATATLPSAATAASDVGGFDLSTIGPGDASAPPLSLSPPTASGGFLQSLETGAVKSLTNNPLGIAVAGGALGYDVLRGNPNTAAENQLSSQASTLTAQGGQLSAIGTQLTQYLQNGTLPPGQQAAVTQAIQARKAQIIANAAANGQNTNPAQNSALAQDLANADMQGLAMAGQLETQLAQTGTTLINSGLNATGLSSEIYQALVKIDQTNNNQLMQAIASMAAALGGGTKIQIGGTAAAGA